MVEGSDAYGLVDASKMSLVPDLVLPHKFKIPTFDKYDGTKCPSAHLYMYCRKMTGHTNNDKLLIHCFQDSLTGSATRWYNQLSQENIRSWTDLAKAFLVQYKHMTDRRQIGCRCKTWRRRLMNPSVSTPINGEI